MVKVLEESEEERHERQRGNRLVEIARETLPGCSIDDPSPELGFLVYLKPSERKCYLSVWPEDNQIVVKKREAFDAAMKLAAAYEERGEPEFSVKKDYQDK